MSSVTTMGKGPNKTDRINVRIEPKLREELDKRAAAESRTTAEIARMWLEERAAERPDEPAEPGREWVQLSIDQRELVESYNTVRNDRRLSAAWVRLLGWSDRPTVRDAVMALERLARESEAARPQDGQAPRSGAREETSPPGPQKKKGKGKKGSG